MNSIVIQLGESFCLVDTYPLPQMRIEQFGCKPSRIETFHIVPKLFSDQKLTRSPLFVQALLENGRRQEVTSLNLHNRVQRS
jgi:hypothetical protein